MIEEKENSKSKSNKKLINKEKDFERNSIKKSTLSLSETPKIINEEINTEIIKKKTFPQILLNEKGLLYPIKLKNSFLNESINNDKDETPTSLDDIKNLINLDTELKNKSLTKKNVKKIKNHISSKRLKSSKYNIKNNLYEENSEKKNKLKILKSRKSDIILKKKNLEIIDSPIKKKGKRKSIISQPNVSPNKIYTTEIFQKFFTKKDSFEENQKIINKDMIYINLQNKENKEELLITVNTTQETIKNYYEYMQECFQIIDLNFNRNIKLQPCEPINFYFKENNKKIVVFELESTLVSYYIEDIDIKKGKNNTLGINLRPYLKESLDIIKKDYNIIIYSSGNKNYVDAILDFIDPEHEYFSLRLYREHCNKFIINNKIYFTKNLNIFKNICNLKDIIIVDCSVIGFGFFLENGIPIIPYYDSKEDVELKLLSYYLISISSNNDLRIALKRDIGLDYYFKNAKEKNCTNEIINNIKNEINNISPENNIIKKKRKNNESKTSKFNTYIHIYKSNSKSPKKKNKTEKISKRTKKIKKEEKDEEDNKYISPNKKNNKKNRKYTTYTQHRNINSIRSPKINSTEKGLKFKSPLKKKSDRNNK